MWVFCCRAQPLAAVLVLVIVIGGSEKLKKSITSTASLSTSTSTMDNVFIRGDLTVPNVHAIALNIRLIEIDTICKEHYLTFFPQALNGVGLNVHPFRKEKQENAKESGDAAPND